MPNARLSVLLCHWHSSSQTSRSDPPEGGRAQVSPPRDPQRAWHGPGSLSVLGSRREFHMPGRSCRPTCGGGRGLRLPGHRPQPKAERELEPNGCCCSDLFGRELQRRLRRCAFLSIAPDGRREGSRRLRIASDGRHRRPASAAWAPWGLAGGLEDQRLHWTSHLAPYWSPPGALLLAFG